MTHKSEHAHTPQEHGHKPREHTEKPKQHIDKHKKHIHREAVADDPKHKGSKSILFMPVGGMSNASTRLICYENARYLRQRGWRVKIGGDPSRNAITIFQKRYNSRDLARAKIAGGKTVLQISEARFMSGSKQRADVIRFAKQVNAVVVGTSITKKWFKSHGVASTVIPTGLDFAQLPQGTRKLKPVKICWIGSARNEKYLAHLVAPLNRLWKDGYDFEFRVIGAKMFPGAWAKPPNFIRWQLGKAEKSVAECHIGVAPLTLGGIELTKPPSKPVLYMALRLSVVATSTPSYQALIQNGVNGFLIPNNSPDSWYNALSSLFNDRKRRLMADQGYSSCQGYNAPNIAAKWDRFLRRLK